MGHIILTLLSLVSVALSAPAAPVTCKILGTTDAIFSIGHRLAVGSNPSVHVSCDGKDGWVFASDLPEAAAGSFQTAGIALYKQLPDKKGVFSPFATLGRRCVSQGSTQVLVASDLEGCGAGMKFLGCATPVLCGPKGAAQPSWVICKTVTQSGQTACEQAMPGRPFDFAKCDELAAAAKPKAVPSTETRVAGVIPTPESTKKITVRYDSAFTADFAITRHEVGCVGDAPIETCLSLMSATMTQTSTAGARMGSINFKIPTACPAAAGACSSLAACDTQKTLGLRGDNGVAAALAGTHSDPAAAALSGGLQTRVH